MINIYPAIATLLLPSELSGLPAGTGGCYTAGAAAALRGTGGLAAMEDLQSLQDGAL